MQHFLINTTTDKTVKVENHNDFYLALEKNPVLKLKEIDLKGKSDIDLIVTFIKTKKHAADEIENFISEHFPIMKVSVYSDNKNVSFTYWGGTSTYKALESVFMFCMKRSFTRIMIYNQRTHKHVETSWTELKDDDSFAKSRLGTVKTAGAFYHYFLNTRTGKLLSVVSHNDFLIDCLRDPKFIKNLDLTASESKEFEKKIMGKQNNPSSLSMISNLLERLFPIVRISDLEHLNISIEFAKANINAIENFLSTYGEKYFKKRTILTFSNIDKGEVEMTWEDFRTEEKNLKRLGTMKTAETFKHYFINSRTGKELAVQDHDTFAGQVRKDPKLFRKLDLDVKFYTKEQEAYYKEHFPAESDYYWFLKISPLIRLTYYQNLVFEYSSTSNNKNDVAEAVYNFCTKHKISPYEIIFISTTTDHGIKKTWGDFKKDYEMGDVRLSSKQNLIKGITNMNSINQQLSNIGIKLAAILPPAQGLFNPDNTTDEINKIKTKIDAGFVNAYVSTLGGKDRATIMVSLTLEPKQEWVNGIMQNASVFHFSIHRNGLVDNFASEWNPKMRKYVARNLDDAIMKINDYLKKGKQKFASVESPTINDVVEELKKNDDSIFNEIESQIFTSPYGRVLKNFVAWLDEHSERLYLRELTGKIEVPLTEVRKVLGTNSKLIKKLSSSDQEKAMIEFLDSYPKLPIEDVFIKTDGDGDYDKVGEIQASFKRNGNKLVVMVPFRDVQESVGDLK